MSAAVPQPAARNAAEGVIREIGPHGSLVLWFPGGTDQTWGRVAGVPYAAVAVAGGTGWNNQCCEATRGQAASVPRRVYFGRP